jgi:hypothetical protein
LAWEVIRTSVVKPEIISGFLTDVREHVLMERASV